MKKRHKLLATVVLIFLLGFLIPQNLRQPVENASSSDYNKDTFWYYPWGKSVTHKGVDFFAKTGTAIHSSVKGIVLYSGEISMGGKVVLVLGPKWRLHYYAHLDTILVDSRRFVNHDTQLGTVGSSGNAVGKSPHLHYSIATLVPYPWRIDKDRQGWKKMFYLNPIKYFET